MGSNFAAWLPGAPVGRYVLIAPLAKGGMAEVWLARQSGLRGFEKVVVIKRLMASLDDDRDCLEMFSREARLVATVNHPNVVQVFELGEDEGAPFIAMEYVDGEPLSSVRREGNRAGKPLPVALAARITAWAAEGLHCAHTRTGPDGTSLCIVHRDVSPQNLIVTFEGSVKLVDFGIASIATQATQSGKLKGKLTYMSPEQARGERLDARTDVFSLGVSCFEIVTQTRLYPGVPEIEVVRRIASNVALPRAKERRAEVPERLDAILAQAMRPRRDERFESAKAFQLALEDWLLETGSRATSSEVADYMNALFAQRREERRSLIDAAMSGEVTVSRFGSRLKAVGASRGSGSLPRAAGVSRRWLFSAVGALVLALAVVSGLLIRSWSSPRTKRPSVGQAGRAAAPKPSTETADASVTSTTDAGASQAVVVVNSRPSGAQVTVDGLFLGLTPLTLEDLSLGDHAMELTLEGHRSDLRAFTIGSSSERIQLLVDLDKEPARAPDAGRSPAPAARAWGKLMLDTNPWTTVYLGRRKLGVTPLLGIALPAGSHVLRLENSEQGLRSSIEVVISPNTTTVKKLSLP